MYNKSHKGFEDFVIPESVYNPNQRNHPSYNVNQSIELNTKTKHGMLSHMLWIAASSMCSQDFRNSANDAPEHIRNGFIGDRLTG